MQKKKKERCWQIEFTGLAEMWVGPQSLNKPKCYRGEVYCNQSEVRLNADSARDSEQPYCSAEGQF